VQATLVTYGMHACNMKFNTQNEELIRARIIIYIYIYIYVYIFTVYLSIQRKKNKLC